MNWTVPWAMWVWGGAIAALLAFELWTLFWYNPRHPGKRANLSAYVSAFFRVGNKRLKYSASGLIVVGVFLYFCGHFLGWWGK